jgi:hypothetical protein
MAIQTDLLFELLFEMCLKGFLKIYLYSIFKQNWKFIVIWGAKPRENLLLLHIVIGRWPYAQRHILRDKWPSTAACPACWAGDNSVRWGIQIFCSGPTRAAKTAKISCTGTPSPTYQPRKDPLSFVLFESPFTSVSTVSRGHSSLVSLLMLYLNPRFPGLDRQLTEVDAIVVHHLFTCSNQSGYWTSLFTFPPTHLS